MIGNCRLNVGKGQFREVKTGVLLMPQERVENSPGRRSVVRRFLVTWLGDADEIFRGLHGQLRELGWVGAHTVVVIVGDGAEWIWNRANMFVQRCEILDFWHALEHAWEFARLRYGEGSTQADVWVHCIAEDLRAGKVQEVIAGLKRLRPKMPELRESLQALIRHYSENAGRMRYDEYLRLEAARLDLLALFRALDRMDLSHAEIPQRLIRQLFELDADYAEALWALDQQPGTLDLRAMLRDTLTALDQLPEACARFRKNLPPRAHPRLAERDRNGRQA